VPLTTVLAAAERLFKEEQGSSCSKEEQGFQRAKSVKYEEVYLHDYETVPQAIAGLGRYFKFYNRERIHQSLDYKTPEIIYRLTA
jgi:transposase InsO family protein